MSNKNEDKIG